jgi:hypothetical protein
LGGGRQRVVPSLISSFSHPEEDDVELDEEEEEDEEAEEEDEALEDVDAVGVVLVLKGGTGPCE